LHHVIYTKPLLFVKGLGVNLKSRLRSCGESAFSPNTLPILQEGVL
jgi:hypothetical protein